MRMVKIPCSGGEHRIGLSPKGRLVFLDHSMKELRGEEILERLSRQESTNRCYMFLKLWRRWNVEDLLVECKDPQVVEMINKVEKVKVKRFIKKQKVEN